MYIIELKADAVTDALGRAVALLDDMTPLMDRIGEVLTASTKARFPLGEAPDGSKWEIGRASCRERVWSDV